MGCQTEQERNLLDLVTVEAEVYRIIRSIFCDPEMEINGNGTILWDLGMDSLDVATLLNDLETMFEIDLTFKELVKDRKTLCVGDVVRYAAEKLP